MPEKGETKALRSIPSVDEVLRTPVALSIEENAGRQAALKLVREAVENARAEINDDSGHEAAARSVEEILISLQKQREIEVLTRVVNATGVIIHTNLGRSLLSAQTIDAVVRSASGYCNVELDLRSGERGRRGLAAERLLAEVCGADEGLIVNNCAAAALLALSALTEGGEVIVSRGELVEIGGDFRIPEVLERSGCKLREVGSTNRTKLADYKRAISGNTSAILRVHPSNYRITGFTEKPQLSDLARLAHENDTLLIEDAGSGALLDLSEYGLGDEPVIADSVAAGADIVTFSGDKLIGGVQAGLVVGKGDLVKKIRGNPLYRALRADKLVYAAVEATLSSFARGSAFEEIPILRMLSMKLDEIVSRAERFKSNFDERNAGKLTLTLESGFSAVGGGTGPGVQLPAKLIAIKHPEISANEISSFLRSFTPPIITRIAEGQNLADMRTMSENDESILLEALLRLSTTDSQQQIHA